MRIIIQRVKSAALSSKNVIRAQIDQGILASLLIDKGDTAKDVELLAKKLMKHRVHGSRLKDMEEQPQLLLRPTFKEM